MTFFLAFVIAFAVSSALIPVILRIARTRGLFDRPDERKTHSGDIPRLGGIGIVLGFLAGLLGTILWVGSRQGLSFPEPRFWPLLAGGVGFHLLGLVDDFKNLQGRLKLAVQALIAVGVVVFGYSFRTVALPGLVAPVDLGWLGPPVSVLWIVGIANAHNLLDGMDGMAGGVSFIALGIWASLFMKDGQLYLATITAIAAGGAVLGFLFYNFPPASIFMGDSGSLFLGYWIAVLPLMGVQGRSGDAVLISGITLSLLPILDTFSAVLRRWKRKVSFFTADRFHLHHKLLNLGFPPRQVLAHTYSACAILGATVLAGAYVDSRMGSLLMMCGWILGVVLFLILHYLKERGLRRRDGEI